MNFTKDDEARIQAQLERKFVLNRDGALRNAREADEQFIEDALAITKTMSGTNGIGDEQYDDESDDDYEERLRDQVDEAEALLAQYGFWVQRADAGDYAIYGPDLSDEEQQYLRELP